jgi:hypothetical protein
MSCVIIGTAALAGVLSGYLRGDDITPVLITMGGGLFATALWWALSRHYLEAWVFGALSGFNLTYALLQLGITNRWYGIAIDDLANVVSFYVATWMFLFTIMGIAVVRTSKGMGISLLAIDAALGIVLAANLRDSLVLLHWAALPLVLVVAVCSYYIAQVLHGMAQRGRQSVGPADGDGERRQSPPALIAVRDGSDPIPLVKQPIWSPFSRSARKTGEIDATRKS